MKKIIIATLAITVLFSCKKEDEPITENPVDTKGAVVLNSSFKVSGEDYHMDSVYVDDFANNYKISFSNIYLSGFSLENSGTVTTFPTQYVLLKPETSSYDLGSVEEGHYHMLTFGNGIDSLTNHTDPNSYPLTSPLYPQSPNMHWAWASGYIFYKIEGTVDTDNDGTFETTFFFHIGTDALRKEYAFTFHDDIETGTTNTIDLEVDLGNFLTGIDLSVDNATHTMNDMPLAVRVATNSETAITIH